MLTRLKNITLKKDAKFETTDKKNPADKLQFEFCINLVACLVKNGGESIRIRQRAFLFPAFLKEMTLKNSLFLSRLESVH